MIGSILASKTRVPPAQRGLIDRPALLAGLAADSPLVLMSAPAGFGKTSLARQYVETLPPDWVPAWVSIDPEDSDPVRFWTTLAAALERALEGTAGSTAFQPIHELARSLQPPMAQEFAAVFWGAADRMEVSVLLVLDDFHLVSSAPVLESFSRLLERMPRRLRVLLLTRVDPPLPLARFRARGMMVEVRADDLRFTTGEAERILGDATGNRLTPSQARVIGSKTEGWGAGLRLAAISLQRRQDPESFVRGFSGSDRIVLEFLTEEVLSAQTEEMRNFLLKTAVLDRFCAELCDVLVSPAPGSQEMLRRIDAANLFLVRLDDEDCWFRYHHLFAETLRARLRALEPGEERSLQKKAAHWYRSQEAWEASLDLFLRSGSSAEAALVLEKVDFMSRGEMSSLVRALEAIGEPVLFTRPRLLDLLGWTKVFSGRIGEAVAFIPRALANLGSLDPEGQTYVRGSFSALTSFIHMLRGDAAPAVAEAKVADSLLGPQDYYPRSILPFVLASALRMEGRLQDAGRELDRLMEIAHAMGSNWTIAVGHYELATNAVLMGLLRRADQVLVTAFADLDSRGAGRFGSAARLRAVYASLLYERNELVLAQAEVNSILVSAERWGLPISIIEVYAIHIKLLLTSGDLAEAGRYLGLCRELIGRGGVPGRIAAIVRCQEVRAALMTGDASWEPPAQPGNDLVAAGFLETANLMVLLAQRRFKPARERAAALGLAASRAGFGLVQVAAQAIEALALAGDRQDREALVVLDAVLEKAQPEGFIRTLVDLGPEMQGLLVRAGSQAHPGRGAYVQRLLSAFPGLPPSTASLTLVSPREREVLDLLVHGHSNREIADRLFISEATVKSHLHHLSDKLDAPNRVAILAAARRLGFVGS